MTYLNNDCKNEYKSSDDGSLCWLSPVQNRIDGTHIAEVIVDKGEEGIDDAKDERIDEVKQANGQPIDKKVHYHGCGWYAVL